MIELPENLSIAYNHFMGRQNISRDRQPYFRQWLHFYVDFVGGLKSPYSLVTQLLYGCGLWLFECLKLRVQDLELFPARMLTFVPEVGEHRRYQLHEKHVQKALKKAVGKAAIPKRATAHTLRHRYASHLLQANYGIRTIQQLLGHADVRTTMTSTHTVQSTTVKNAKSPLDF